MVSQKKLECVLIERKENIATIIMNLPEKRNFLSPEMTRDLTTAWKELGADDSVDVVICTGAGDIAWSAGMSGQRLLAGRDDILTGRRTIPETVLPREEVGPRNVPKISIAAVNGYCLGAAFGMYCEFDLGMASEERARFGLPEVMRGTAVGGNINWGALQHMSAKWAMDLAVTGDNIDARTAQMIGLVSRVVPHAELRQRAFEWAKEISRWDRITVEYIKRQVRTAQEQLGHLNAQTINMMISDEMQRVNPKGRAGFTEFLAKKGAGPATAMAKWVK